MKKITSTLILFLFIESFASGFTVTISSTNVTCYGACDGTASPIVTGGVGPFSFEWTAPSGIISTAQNAVGLCAGTYTVTVIDSGMSTATATVTILTPAAITISLP